MARDDGLDSDGRDFLIYARLELGLAANSLQAYRRDLLLLAEAAAALALHPSEAGPDEVARVLAWLRDERHLAPASLARLLVTWRMRQRYLVLEGRVQRDRVELARAPRLWQQLPEVLEVAEVDRLLAAAAPGPMQLRDRCALELLYACGARASEVCGLGLADLREDATLLLLRGKGDKERLVPLGGRARTALRSYLRDLRPSLEGGRRREALLLSRRGLPLSRQALWRIVRSAGQLAGLRKPVWTHLLRHSFATHLIAGGADLRAVQELLGHANMTTTERYTHVDRRRLQAVHRQFHPRAE